MSLLLLSMSPPSAVLHPVRQARRSSAGREGRRKARVGVGEQPPRGGSRGEVPQGCRPEGPGSGAGGGGDRLHGIGDGARPRIYGPEGGVEEVGQGGERCAQGLGVLLEAPSPVPDGGSREPEAGGDAAVAPPGNLE